MNCAPAKKILPREQYFKVTMTGIVITYIKEINMRTSTSTIVTTKKLEPNTVIPVLFKDLESKNGLVRETARKKLVGMGSSAVDYLSDLVSGPDDTVRWEAFKALSEIADPSSTPILIHSLYDVNEEIRWIAAEGLIAIGRNVVEPLLEELLKNPRSFRLKRGVHHVLTGLSTTDKSVDFTGLLDALNDQSTKIHVPTVTYNVLRKVKKQKSEKKPVKVRKGLH
jgi:hypothetical protein